MPAIDVSLVILTWNRWPSVEKSLAANLASSGFPLREIIHVDNGSGEAFTQLFKRRFEPSVQILHAGNEGVARGYNRGMALASGSHVVITGCDRIMPSNWLKTWIEYLYLVPNTGVISCYSQHEKHNHAASRLREVVRVGGTTIQRALPVEARIHSRDFLFKTGFWREDFGLYGYEDAEWADRADRTAREHGLINYVIPSMPYAHHLPSDDFQPKVGEQTYNEFKAGHAKDRHLKSFYRYCQLFGSPHYNPYARVEPNRLLEREV